MNLPSLKTTTLPSMPVSDNLDIIIGTTVGKYFDYKRDTKRIEYEIEELKSQTKIVIKKIDAELIKSLDSNEKNFKQEMKRLDAIGQELKFGRESRSKILKSIDKYVLMLSDKNISKESKEMIPDLIQNANNLLNIENELAFRKLMLMSNYNPDTKLIGGE